jgi:hypothetical protein
VSIGAGEVEKNGRTYFDTHLKAPSYKPGLGSRNFTRSLRGGIAREGTMNFGGALPEFTEQSAHARAAHDLKNIR